MDLNSGRELWHRRDDHGDRMQFSPDGRTLALSPLWWRSVRADKRHVCLFDSATGQQLAAVPADYSCGWAADCQLLVVRGDDLLWLDGRMGSERDGRPAVSHVGGIDACVFRSGQFLFVWREREPSALLRRVVEWLSFDPLRLSRTRNDYEVVDLKLGQSCGLVTTTDELGTLSADGRALVTTSNMHDELYVWDVPPRTPVGVVLGLMIAQVGLLTAWTAWWRRRASRRQRDVQDTQRPDSIPSA